MDEFGSSKDNAEVVILPCKAHFFHELCIGEWIKKQNACPVCRKEITMDELNIQQKEVKKLLSEIKSDCDDLI